MTGNRALALLLTIATCAIPGVTTAQEVGGTGVREEAEGTKAPLDPAEEQRQLDELFKSIDANGNGRMTRHEMTVYAVERNMGSLVRRTRWKRADANGNGWLSSEELSKYLRRERDRDLASRR